MFARKALWYSTRENQKNANAKLLLLVKPLQPFNWSEIGIKHLGLCHLYKYICYQSCVGLNCVWTNFVFAENILRKQWKIRKNFRGISKCWVFLKFSQKERYNISWLRRVWLVKSWLATGKSLNFFTVYFLVVAYNIPSFEINILK